MTVHIDAFARPLCLPEPGDPAIGSEWLVAGYTGPVAVYGAPVWPLAPLVDNPSAVRQSIYWNEFPARMREEFRITAWTMINGALSNGFLHGRATAWRSRMGAEGVYSTVLRWRRLAFWLQKHGVTTFAEVTPQMLADYAASVRGRGVTRGDVSSMLTALTRLWAFDQISLAPVGVCEPPWEKEGVDDYLPAATSAGENSTAPITERTMGPILIWAMRMVDDFADDILAAWSERQRLRAAAMRQKATGASRKALMAFLDDVAAEGRPVPAFMDKGEYRLAQIYLAGTTGASLGQLQHAARRRGWAARAKENPGQCFLTTPVTGMAGGRTWRTAIDYFEAATLMRHLGTACFIVIAYLTGMRPGEVLGLRTGCCPDPEDEGRHLIRGNVYKTARDEKGNHLSSGQLREVPWVAIAPVVHSIRVLERFVPDGHLLFDHEAHDLLASRPGVGALSLDAVGERIGDFIAWANEEATRLALPGDVIPPDRHGNVSSVRFRRTLAWHIARRPGGLVALAVQYGHMRTAISVGYASRSRDGIHDLLDVETARATIDTVADLQASLEAGDGVSGPAARRAINAAAQAPQFVGTIVTVRQARSVMGNPDLAVYDNPNALLMCVYKADKALCQREGTKNAPSLDRCVSTCANIARTDHQADQLRLRAAELEWKAEHVPHELAQRFRMNAARLRQTADRHHQTRITLKNENDQ
ncbi:integrase [Streptomyces sp. NPDC127036]|uniref:integrase n=1 Tax=Streptomyces sp. NPDC127036 TaxID=3347112 RepID=UPI003648426E